MAKTDPSAAAAKAASGSKVKSGSTATWDRLFRETIESIAIAFILAFLFRTFEAEAFVIPTGSMAPTLMGRHKDVECEMCKYHYQVNASSETNPDGQEIEGNDAVTGMCPMCGYTQDFKQHPAEYPSYNGDRILVNKFIYDLTDPQRWDVIVFKFPGDAKVNYIKRLIGCPGEEVLIKNGDIFIKPPGGAEFEIARKENRKLQAMLQIVYDNDYVLDKLLAAGWPARWQAWTEQPAAGDWQTADGSKTFTIDGSAGGEHWLRYQHFPTTDKAWQEIIAAETAKVAPHISYIPEPTLIKDFYAYDAGTTQRGFGGQYLGDNWVGDLALDCELQFDKQQGVVVLELIRAGHQFQCHLDLQKGSAELRIPDRPEFSAVAQNVVSGSGPHPISFTNVDHELRLWIDGKPVQFSGKTSYEAFGQEIAVQAIPRPGSTSATDLSPAGIASTGGAAAHLSHIRLRRDVFYAIPANAPGRSVFSNPDGSVAEEQHFKLEADQFFVCGDNSPESSDGRFWKNQFGQYYVDRKLLTGKALFIYWPHSLELQIAGHTLPFPLCWPNFKRMSFVR